MAKNPCKFRIKGTDEWVDAVTLKKRLNEGLLDQYIKDGVVSMPSLSLQKPVEKVAKKSEVKPATEPTVEELAKEAAEGDLVTFVYNSKSEVPDVFKDKISSEGEVNGKTVIRVTVPKSLAEKELSKQQQSAKLEQKTTESTQEVEQVVLPPVGNAKQPRVFERIDGEWKMKTGDGHSEVSDIIKKDVEAAYVADQQYKADRAREKAKREQGKVEETILKFLDGMKIDPSKTRSTILPNPIPPKIWNDFIDLVKAGMKKGFEFKDAVARAKRQILAPEVKAGNISKKDVDAQTRAMVNQYTTRVAKQTQANMQKGQPIGKAVAGAKESMNDMDAKPEKSEKGKTYTSLETIRKAISAYDAGAKNAKKNLRDIKKAVTDYIKENVDLKDNSTLRGMDTKVMLNQVRKAEDIQSLRNAFDMIDKVASRQEGRKKDNLIKELSDLVAGKNLISGKGPKRQGKIPVESQVKLSTFLASLPPIDAMKKMSLDEIQEYYDIAQGIIAEGKVDKKAKKRLQEKTVRIEKAIVTDAIYKGKRTQLNTKSEIENHLETVKGDVIVNGQLVTNATQLQEVISSDSDIQSAVGLEYMRTVESSLDNPWYVRYINPLAGSQFISNQLKSLYKNKQIKEMFEKFFSDGINVAAINMKEDRRSIMRDFQNRMNGIFGGQKKAVTRLSQIPKNVSIRKENTGDSDIFTNDQIVMLYCHAQTEGGVEMLQSKYNNIDTDAVINYVESNPDLKAYSDYIMNDFLPMMKQIAEPIYEGMYDLKMPDGKYFPRYVDVNSLDGNYTVDDIVSGNTGGQSGTVIASSLNQRVAKNPTIDMDYGATSILMNYTDSILKSKHFIPVAKKFDSLIGSRSMSKYIKNSIGESRTKDLLVNMSAAITGANPYAARNKSKVNRFLNNVATPVAALFQIGWKLASFPKQMVPYFNYYVAGIKYGVYPWHVMTANAPTSSKEVEVIKKWLTSADFKDRYSQNEIDHTASDLKKSIVRWKNSRGRAKSEAYKVLTWTANKYMELGMSPTKGGDLFSVGVGGSPFMLAMYRKGISDGMSHEQALDWAYEATSRETKETQQSSAEIATTNIQRDPLAKGVLMYRSGQVGMFNKMVGAVKVLANAKGDIYTAKEKAQAVVDLGYYAMQAYAYNLVAQGVLNYYASGSEDEEKETQLQYNAVMGSIQSTMQGYGFYGAIMDWVLNAAQGKEVFNNLPVWTLFQEDIPVAMRLSFVAGDEGWDSLTESEKNKISRGAGVLKMIEQFGALKDAYKGDKSVFDAIMLYDPDKKTVNENDIIYKFFIGDPGGSTSGGSSSDDDSQSDFDDSDFEADFEEDIEE